MMLHVIIKKIEKMGLFSIFKDDWIVVWSISGDWNIVNDMSKPVSEPGNLISQRRSTYIIKYSEARDKFKLELDGYKPKEHDSYDEALKVLSEFQRDIRKMSYERN